MMNEDVSEDIDVSTSGDVSTPSWMLDDATPGIGDRPDWLPEKFKTAADLGKSYRELEKMRASSAPAEYDLSKARNVDTNFEAFENLKKVAKDNRVPQNVMDEFVNTVDSYIEQNQVSKDAEMEKLGTDAKQRIEVLESWVENNLESDSANALFDEITTAEGIKALETLRNKFMENQTSVPTGNDVESENSGSLEDIQKELSNNIEKYKTDTKYQREIQSKLSRFVQSSNYVDKIGS